MAFLQHAKHDRTFQQPVVWATSLVLLAFHLGAVAPLFFFTSKAFFVSMYLW